MHRNLDCLTYLTSAKQLGEFLIQLACASLHRPNGCWVRASKRWLHNCFCTAWGLLTCIGGFACGIPFLADAQFGSTDVQYVAGKLAGLSACPVQRERMRRAAYPRCGRLPSLQAADRHQQKLDALHNLRSSIRPSQYIRQALSPV